MGERQKQKAAKKGLNRRLLYAVVLVTLIFLTILVTYYLFFQPRTQNWTAAIIDQLTIQQELANPSFRINCTSILNSSGFEVEYYEGKDVTVNFYKDLSSKGSKIIILRVHSAVRNDTDYVDLFTSEPFVVGKYAAYGNQISRATFLYNTSVDYFAIGPTFVDFSMQGRFDSNCVVILMGCDSVNKTSMAKALVDKGARVVIGWTRLVELHDTDESALKLLRYLLIQENNVETAVSKIGPQYPYGATLDYYPESAGNYIIPKRSEGSFHLTATPFQALLLAIPLERNRERLRSF